MKVTFLLLQPMDMPIYDMDDLSSTIHAHEDDEISIGRFVIESKEDADMLSKSIIKTKNIWLREKMLDAYFDYMKARSENDEKED